MGSIAIPFASTSPVFVNSSGIVQNYTDDFESRGPLHVDNAFMCSVLTFGAVIPPLTPYTGISQLLPGYTYKQTEQRIHLESATPRKWQPTHIPVQGLLDERIKSDLETDMKPVVLFSGGVDSSVIAARLLAIGVTNAKFVHYSFADNDAQTEIALAMAKQLGINLHIIRAVPAPTEATLQAISELALPFADHACIPAFDLVSQLTKFLDHEPHLIFDGTGADGVFGMRNSARKWRNLFRIPKWIRALGASPYGISLATKVSAQERITRLLRRSCQLPLPAAALAQNPLMGLVYTEIFNGKLAENIQQWLMPISGNTVQQQIIAMDIALVGARIFAQKTVPFLEKAGHQVSMPFLDDGFFAYAMATAKDDDTPVVKAELKSILATHVDKDLVYRPKSGFLEPQPRVFYQSWFQELIEDAFKGHSRISELLNPDLHKMLLLALRRNQTLPPQTYNALWAIAALHYWVRQRT